MSPLVMWPSVLGICFLVAGLATYRHDLFDATAGGGARLRALGPVLIAAALACFAGEHFTQAQGFSQMVPKYLPLRVPIVYFVGGALLAAALSFVARRCVRWSAPLLGLTFALFVLLIYLPAAIAHPHKHIFWIFPFREGTYALSGFAIFAYAVRDSWRSAAFAWFAQLWTAGVLIFYGLQNILHPEFSPGVPDTKPTSAWVPAPLLLSYGVGAVMALLGATALAKKTGVAAITAAGVFLTLLTLVLYTPELFLARNVEEMITAINFVADTLLFAGAMFAIARSIAAARPAAAESQRA